jgi:cytochrome P450
MVFLRFLLLLIYTMQTVSAITLCIMGLLENPHILHKAQAELDSVVKTGHLPDLEDQSSLPYITALVKETLRWRDVIPIGEPLTTAQ